MNKLEINYLPSNLGAIKSVLSIPSNQFYIPELTENSGKYEVEYPNELNQYTGSPLGSMYGYNESLILRYLLQLSGIESIIHEEKLSLVNKIAKMVNKDYYRYCNIEIKVPRDVYNVTIKSTELDTMIIVNLDHVLCKVFDKNLWIPGYILNSTIEDEITKLFSFLSVKRN